ncbi:MAG TPA: S9 family peptidase [Candidatus Acidoferrales bacterium]
MRSIRLISMLSLICQASVAGVGAQAPDGVPRPASTAAPASNAPTIDQSLEMKTASAPRISPDGRWVVYQVSETNWTDNAFETELWVVEVASGARFQLTNAKRSSNTAAWSPDGRRIAFVSNRDGRRQIYLISPRGGEAMPLTKHETGVNSIQWSPDGRRIAFTAADPESKARKEKKEKLGEVAWEDEQHTMSHLWVVDVPAEQPDKLPEAMRLTEGDTFTVGSFSWSPDGTRMAFSAAQDPDPASGGTSDIYIVTVAPKALRKLVDTPGPDSNPMWSPDGGEIAYTTSAGKPYYYYQNNEIAVVPVEGGTPGVLTEAFDENKSLAGWNRDGIYFTASQRMAAHLFRLNPATRAIERVSTPDDGIYFGFNFTADARQAAFTCVWPNRYSEVCVSPLRGFAPRTLTSMGEQLAAFRTSVREVIRWKSPDGAEIEGVLYKPRDFDPKKKYPLLVVIHGGPTGVDRPMVFADRTYPLEQFVAKGALILRPNYRGSAGYGEKFRALNVRNLGVGDAWDVISGVDYLVAQGYVDRDRVGSMGWSQGGYISAFLTTSSDRFKAISVGAGISNWMTYYVNTDIHPFTRMYLKATPWDDPEIYAKTSPMTYINQASTPTLIQHGSNDRRVPIPNAYELYQGLRDKGVPVRLQVFPGFGHGINRPKEQRAVMQANLDWFARYIWGESPAQD